jgi:hypothetical protein
MNAFDELQVNDTVGRTNFPYEFMTIMKKEIDLVIVQKTVEGRPFMGALPREAFDKGIFLKYTIEEAEIIKEEEKQQQALAQ